MTWPATDQVFVAGAGVVATGVGVTGVDPPSLPPPHAETASKSTTPHPHETERPPGIFIAANTSTAHPLGGGVCMDEVRVVSSQLSAISYQLSVPDLG